MTFDLVCVTYFINKTSKFVLLFGRIVVICFFSLGDVSLLSFLPALFVETPPHISLSLKELRTFRCEERLILKATGRNRTSIVAKATPRRALRRLVACWKGGTPPFSMVSLGWVRRGAGCPWWVVYGYVGL